MDRITLYFKFVFTTDIWEEISDDIEAAIRGVAVDLGVLNIISGGVMTQHSPVPNLSIDVSQTVARDYQGKRIDTRTLSNLAIDVDSNHITTQVSTAGNEKWLGIFVAFERIDQDPRVDGNGNTVFMRHIQAAKFLIVQSVEGLLNTVAKVSAPGPEWVRIGDVHRTFAQTQIFNADIDQSLKQTRTIGVADEILFNDVNNRFPVGTDTVFKAIDYTRANQIVDETNLATVQTLTDELKKRYYTVGVTDLRTYLDADNNLLYTMKGELYHPRNLAFGYNGTQYCAVFETTENEISRKIIARLFDPTGPGTYFPEVEIAVGNVSNPRVVWTGTYFAITWLNQATPTDKFEIRMIALALSNNVSGLPATDINGVASHGIEDDTKRRYQICWDGVEGKVGITWKSYDNKIWWRSVAVTTSLGNAVLTKGPLITRIDAGATTSGTYEDPSIDYGNGYFGVAYRRIDTNTYCIRGINAVSEAITPVITSETSIAGNTGYVPYSIHCAFAANGNQNFTFTALDSLSQVSFFRCSSSVSPFTSIISVGTFNDGAAHNVLKVYDSIWHAATNNVTVFYAVDNPGDLRKISYIEVTDLSVSSGAIANFAGSDDSYFLSDGVVSNFLSVDSGAENYRVLWNDPQVSFPFNIRKLRYVTAGDQQSGDISVNINEYRQGHGGCISYLLRANASQVVKYRVAHFDGDSVTMADKHAITFTIPPSLFTSGSDTVTELFITAGDYDTIDNKLTALIAYNVGLFLYRWDQALGYGALVVGNECYSAGPRRIFNPILEGVEISQLIDTNRQVQANFDELSNDIAALSDSVVANFYNKSNIQVIAHNIVNGFRITPDTPVSDQIDNVKVAAGTCFNSSNTTFLQITASSTTVLLYSNPSTTPVFNGWDGSNSANTPTDNTFIYLYVIGDSTSVNPTGFIGSSSATTPSLPSGYDVYRKIGVFLTTATTGFSAKHIVPFQQIGTGNLRKFMYWTNLSDRVVLSTATPIGYTSIDLSPFLPIGTEESYLWIALSTTVTATANIIPDVAAPYIDTVNFPSGAASPISLILPVASELVAPQTPITFDISLSNRKVYYSLIATGTPGLTISVSGYSITI